MPRFTPLRALPARFADVEALLADMTIHQKDGSKGLLAKHEVGHAVQSRLALHNVDGLLEYHHFYQYVRDIIMESS